jgi:hypothetical protein
MTEKNKDEVHEIAKSRKDASLEMTRIYLIELKPWQEP